MFVIYLFDLHSCNKRLSLRDMVVLIINPARDLHNLFFRAFMLTSSLKHKAYQILNKRRGGQSRMDNPETLATLDTQTQKHNTSQETSRCLSRVRSYCLFSKAVTLVNTNNTYSCVRQTIVDNLDIPAQTNITCT